MTHSLTHTFRVCGRSRGSLPVHLDVLGSLPNHNHDCVVSLCYFNQWSFGCWWGLLYPFQTILILVPIVHPYVVNPKGLHYQPQVLYHYFIIRFIKIVSITLFLCSFALKLAFLCSCLIALGCQFVITMWEGFLMLSCFSITFVTVH